MRLHCLLVPLQGSARCTKPLGRLLAVFTLLSFTLDKSVQCYLPWSLHSIPTIAGIMSHRIATAEYWLRASLSTRILSQACGRLGERHPEGAAGCFRLSRLAARGGTERRNATNGSDGLCAGGSRHEANALDLVLFDAQGVRAIGTAAC